MNKMSGTARVLCMASYLALAKLQPSQAQVYSGPHFGQEVSCYFFTGATIGTYPGASYFLRFTAHSLTGPGTSTPYWGDGGERPGPQEDPNVLFNYGGYVNWS